MGAIGTTEQAEASRTSKRAKSNSNSSGSRETTAAATVVGVAAVVVLVTGLITGIKAQIMRGTTFGLMW